MFLPHDLDYHRLHEVIGKIHRSEYIGRGEGQTVARIYLMFGEVETGDPGGHYLYVAENALCAKLIGGDFFKLICDVYPEMGGGLQHRAGEWNPSTVVLPNKQLYRFISIEELVRHPDGMRGSIFTKIFFDVSEDKQNDYDVHDRRLIEVMGMLEQEGAEFV